jgi:ABC-type ATPase with predicted acetyltransferase domain
MSQYVETNTKAFTAAGTIKQYARVTIGSGGTITEAGLAVKDIGTAMEPAVSGDVVSVKLRSGSGTHKMIAIEALAIGATLYTETDGKVQDTAASTSFQLGTALEAATADGDIIEVLYNQHGDTATA